MTSTRSMTRARLRAEGGFSLPELMISMMIALLIAFAMLTVFEAFDRGVAANSSLTDAEDNGRRDVAEMVRILRDAGAPAPKTGNALTTVLRADPNDIVFLSTSWPGESATGGATNVQRLCLDTATKTVYFDGKRNATTDDAGGACPSTASGWTHEAIATEVANTAALPLFRYGSGPVRSLGISLRSDSSTNRSTSSLLLASGGTLRGALPPSVLPGDIDVECDADGSGKPMLSLNADSGLKLLPTATGAITLGPGKILLTTVTSGQVALAVTNAAGLQTLLFKDISC